MSIVTGLIPPLTGEAATRHRARIRLLQAVRGLPGAKAVGIRDIDGVPTLVLAVADGVDQTGIPATVAGIPVVVRPLSSFPIVRAASLELARLDVGTMEEFPPADPAMLERAKQRLAELTAADHQS